MKLYTLARTKSEHVTDDRSVGVTSISSWVGGPKFPPLFLSIDSAKDWQQKITNPLFNDDLLNRAHWDQCHIVELDLERGTFITEVEKAAIAFVNAFTAEKEDAAEVEKTVHALIEKIKSVNLSFL